MTLEHKYTSEKFLKVLSENIPKSTAAVTAEVGCGKNTARRYLAELEEEGKIKKARIEGLVYFGWLRVPQLESDKMPGPSKKTQKELEDSIHFWCCIDEFREEHPDNNVAELVCALIHGADPELYDNSIVDEQRVEADIARLREWLLK